MKKKFKIEIKKKCKNMDENVDPIKYIEIYLFIFVKRLKYPRLCIKISIPFLVGAFKALGG